MSYCQLKEFRIPKSTCPYIAFPFPGERPLVVERAKLAAVLRGIRLTDVSLEKLENGCKVLRLAHVTGKVRGKYTFVDQLRLDNLRIRESIERWAATERKKRARELTTIPEMPVKYQTAIRKLEREIEKQREGNAPKNPLCMANDRDHEYVNAQLARLSADRPHRVKIARVAGQVISNKLTSTTGYKRLRELGYQVRTWSQVTQPQRDRTGVKYEDNYWKQVWRFCGVDGITRKDVFWSQYDITEQLKDHAQARLRYLAERNQRRELDARLASVRELASDAMASQMAKAQAATVSAE